MERVVRACVDESQTGERHVIADQRNAVGCGHVHDTAAGGCCGFFVHVKADFPIGKGH